MDDDQPRSMPSDLKLLLRRFERHLADTPAAPSFTLPPTLFHYTSASGFAGIIRERLLHATNFSFMNDPSEVGFGRSLVERVLQGQSAEPHSASAHLISRTLANVRDQILAEVYVCCFTSLSDDISQWRAYGSASSARYCIGFDTEILHKLANKLPNTVFDRVIYQGQAQVERVEGFLARALEFVRAQQVSPAAIEPVAEVLASHLVRLVCLLKSPAYHAEEEWRIITIKARSDIAGIAFDATRDTIKPYLKFELQHRGQIPISSVLVLAPSRPQAAVKAADLMLRSVGARVRASHSQVPYAE